jgi:hypothetical protein
MRMRINETGHNKFTAEFYYGLVTVRTQRCTRLSYFIINDPNMYGPNLGRIEQKSGCVFEQHDFCRLKYSTLSIRYLQFQNFHQPFDIWRNIDRLTYGLLGGLDIF